MLYTFPVDTQEALHGPSLQLSSMGCLAFGGTHLHHQSEEKWEQYPLLTVTSPMSPPAWAPWAATQRLCDLGLVPSPL